MRKTFEHISNHSAMKVTKEKRVIYEIETVKKRIGKGNSEEEKRVR